jgi:hypothetical protein
VLHLLQQVRSLVASKSPYLQVFEVTEGVGEGRAVGGVNTIISLTVHVPDASGESAGTASMKRLTFDECKSFHHKMTLVQNTGSDANNNSESKPGKTRAMLGQPVKLSDDGLTVLRIALGADTVIEALSSPAAAAAADGSAYEKIMKEDVRVVEKMVFLAQNWAGAVSRPPASKASSGRSKL